MSGDFRRGHRATAAITAHRSTLNQIRSPSRERSERKNWPEFKWAINRATAEFHKSESTAHGGRAER